MHLLYLHGFRSSPQSSKAKLMAAKLRMAHRKKAGIQWPRPQQPITACASLCVDMAMKGKQIFRTERLLRVGVDARCVWLNPAPSPVPHPARDGSGFLLRPVTIKQ
jgi:Uncharacterised protein family (UPF0227)